MRYTGAGVIPFTLRDDYAHLLLGRENWNRDWPEGSHRWSGFSGRLEPHEEPIACAAREFFEETCGCVQLDETTGSAVHIQDTLATRGRLLQSTSLTHDREETEALVYSTYIVFVEDFDYPTLFMDTRRQLLDMERVLCNYYCQMHRFRQRNGFGFLFPGYRFGMHVAVCNFRVDAVRGELAVTFCDDYEDVFEQVLRIPCDGAIQSLERIAHAWQNVLDYLNDSEHKSLLEHPAVNVQRVGQQVVHVSINKNFLEKCELGWWKLDDVLSEPVKSMRFRRLFLEVAPALAREISTLVAQTATAP